MHVKELLEYYRKMLLIRRFEEELARLFTDNLVGGTSHFCIGQEACAVGVIEAGKDTDYIVSNHRGHGHMLARGLDPEKVFAELMGNADGYCRGRGGSQHISCMEKYFLGTNGITGGGLPIAVGAARALKHTSSSSAVICFFGDGASNQGTFHESLNLAALWKAPILFVCENNFYGMSTPVSNSMACTDFQKRAAAYDIPFKRSDGMDVQHVYNTAAELSEGIHRGNGPAFLELQTYRFCGHSKNDPRVYRTDEEEADWKRRDCLAVISRRLLEGGVKQGELEGVDQSVTRAIQSAAKQAAKGAELSRQEIMEGVYV